MGISLLSTVAAARDSHAGNHVVSKTILLVQVNVFYGVHEREGLGKREILNFHETLVDNLNVYLPGQIQKPVCKLDTPLLAEVFFWVQQLSNLGQCKTWLYVFF